MLFTLKVKAKRIYYECVSYRIPIDAYPMYYKHLTLNGTISLKVKNEMINNGYDTNDMYFMKNYTDKEFFNCVYKCNGKLSKIAIVSNHVPKELKERGFNDFYFEKLMEDLLEEINSKNEIDYQKLYEEYPTLGYTSRTYIEDRDFLSKENLKWYNKSQELGDLYQGEIKKMIDVLSKYDVLLQSYNSILNSKGWKLLEKVKKIKG